jgi:cob(I)alamin adenosyltransferase
MLLREFFYFDKTTLEPIEDDRYDSSVDFSSLNRSDTRKTRLTLKQINRLRKAADMHEKEKNTELEFIKQMYGIPEAPAGGI